ncbi:MAG: hypothetical protein EBU81_15260, partial [Proteobacteria bacterium]|nr:hypothetical protein [Pseudomonadota bacterium]
RMDYGKMKRRIAFTLRAAMSQHGTFSEVNFKHRIMQILRAATHGRFQQGQLCASTKPDYMARVKSEGATRIDGNGEQFQMPTIHTRRHIQEQPIFKHQRVQRCHRVVNHRRQGTEHPFQHIQMLRD